MTFLEHITETSRSHAASSRTLGGQLGLAVRKERRFSVSQHLHLSVPAGTLRGKNEPRSYLAGDPWRGSGP